MAFGVRSSCFAVFLAVCVAWGLVIPLAELGWEWVIHIIVVYNPPSLIRRKVKAFLSKYGPPQPFVEPERPPTLLERLAAYQLPVVDWYLVASIAMGGIAFLMVIRLLAPLFFNRYRRTIMRMRGIQFESMREGSDFAKGSIPRYQIAIKQPGVWGDSHIGYGIRYGNFLILPRHVFQDVGENMLLEGRVGKKVILAPSMIQSRIVHDLGYIWLPDKAWVTLGVATATLAKAANFPLVSCSGLEGSSSGMLRKSQTKGIVVYNGSTVPGMSGAAYDGGNVCYGIHIGAAGSNNIGVSSLALRIELKHIVAAESSEDVAAGYIQGGPLKMKGGQSWTEQMLSEMADRNWTGDSWLDDTEIDYSATLDFGESSKKKKAPGIMLDNVKVDFSAQSGGSSNQTMECLSDRIVQMVLAHDEKLAQLEKALLDIQVRSSEKYPCPKCKVICRTQERLDAHLENAHSAAAEKVYHTCECGNQILKKNLARHQSKCIKGFPLVDITTGVKPESAVRGDDKSSVKQGPFLGKRSSSPKMIGRSLTRNSKLSVKKPQSQSLEDVLSGIMESQKAMYQLFKELQKPMGGQSLEGKRSLSL